MYRNYLSSFLPHVPSSESNHNDPISSTRVINSTVVSPISISLIILLVLAEYVHEERDQFYYKKQAVYLVTCRMPHLNFSLIHSISVCICANLEAKSRDLSASSSFLRIVISALRFSFSPSLFLPVELRCKYITRYTRTAQIMAVALPLLNASVIISSMITSCYLA